MGALPIAARPFGWLVVLGTALAPMSAWAAEAPVISAEQAIARARVFTAALGVEVPAEVGTRLVHDPGRTAWDLDFLGGLCRVDAASGRVVSFVNSARSLFYSRGERPIPSAASVISEEEAKWYADRAVELIHPGVPLRFYSCQWGGLPRAWHGTEWGWRFWYARYHNGYRYHRYGVHVRVDPFDGTVIACGVSPDAETCPTNVVITAEEALALGRRALLAAGFDAPPPSDWDSAELLIAQPNYVYTPRHTDWDPASRLAWIVRYGGPYPFFEEWIDAENGAVLGGDRSGRAPGPEARSGKAAHLIEGAGWAELLRVGSPGKTEGVRVLRIARTSAEWRVVERALLSAAEVPARKVHGLLPDALLVLRYAGGRKAFCPYVRKERVLRVLSRDGKPVFLRAPAEFAKAMDALLTQH